MLSGYHAVRLGNLTSIQRSDGVYLVSGDYQELLALLVDGSLTDLRVVWSLPEFVSCIREVLPADLSGDGQQRATWYDRGNRYRVFYQPGKFLSVNVNHREVNFYELDQFFPDDRRVRSAVDVERYGLELLDAFRAVGISRVDNLKSPVAVIEASGVLDEFYEGLPDPLCIPAGCCEYAVQTGIQAWQTAYQVGYWDRAYGYDVASCYPGRAVRLLSLDGAEYRFSKTMLPAAYGFVFGDMEIFQGRGYLSPLVVDVDGMWCNPEGHLFRDYYTLEQVRFVEGNGIGRFSLRSGWFITLKSGNRPFERVMHSLFPLRRQGELVSQVVKRVIDGIIGRLGQYIRNEPTQWTNPVYHSLIRTGAGVQVSQFLLKYDIREDELIHVNTDGVHLTRDIPLPGKAQMGEWRAEGGDKLMVLSPGKVLEGEDCDTVVEMMWTSRSITKYDDIDFMSLPVEQNRYFPKFPRNGGQLLRGKYPSESIYLG